MRVAALPQLVPNGHAGECAQGHRPLRLSDLPVGCCGTKASQAPAAQPQAKAACAHTDALAALCSRTSAEAQKQRLRQTAPQRPTPTLRKHPPASSAADTTRCATTAPVDGSAAAKTGPQPPQSALQWPANALRQQ